MSENSTNNKKPNITGTYKNVTGTYKKQGTENDTKVYRPLYQEADDTSTKIYKPAKEPASDIEKTQLHERVVFDKKESAPKCEPEEEKKTKSDEKSDTGFDWKLWFSQDNVKAFLRQLRFYGIIVVISILLTVWIVNVANDVFAFIKPDEALVATIPQGSSTETIAKELDKAGVIDHPLVFRLYCKLKKAEGKFQYGDYSLNSNYSYDRIISALKKVSVQAETVTLTVPEGATQDEITEILTAGKYVNITELEQALNTYKYDDFEFVSKLPERRCRLEGYLPAGDYEIYKGESAVSIVSKMLTRFQETILTEQNITAIEKTGKTLDQLVITASLVQAECTNPADYKNAASVLANRLSSPTDNYLKLTSPINYVLNESKQVMSATEMNTESSYNTYLYAGLTPGPVCTPSAAAFDAVINPESTAYTYFISDGDTTTFSTTAEEHAAALDKASRTAKGTEVIR